MSKGQQITLSTSKISINNVMSQIQQRTELFQYLVFTLHTTLGFIPNWLLFPIFILVYILLIFHVLLFSLVFLCVAFFIFIALIIIFFIFKFQFFLFFMLYILVLKLFFISVNCQSNISSLLSNIYVMQIQLQQKLFQFKLCAFPLLVFLLVLLSLIFLCSSNSFKVLILIVLVLQPKPPKKSQLLK